MNNATEMNATIHHAPRKRRRARVLREAQARATVETLKARNELRDNLYDVFGSAHQPPLNGDILPLPWHQLSQQQPETSLTSLMDANSTLAKRSIP